MKKIFLFASLLLSLVIHAQILDPVKWKTSVKQLSNNEFELVRNSTIYN
ncbi:MAG: hypothetical protein KYX68_07280 [Flavobacterium sp.]|nr:hypothetical protein [Flavobacterium sp.]